MNSYFATIEQQLDHTLRGKPIAVVANLSNSTSAIAVSYEATKLGISTGTKIFEAKRIYPKLVCVVSKHEEYTKYHKAIFAGVEKHLHVDKILSIDEGACRLTGELCKQENAINLLGFNSPKLCFVILSKTTKTFLDTSQLCCEEYHYSKADKTIDKE